MQESSYPSLHTNAYKFGLSETGSLSYYDYGHSYVGECILGNDEYGRHMENTSTIPNDRVAALHTQREGVSTSVSRVNRAECKS